MNSFRYTFLMLLRGRTSQITKILSLTLGLFIGILLFACVAFQLSFNKWFRQPEKLYVTYLTNTLNGEIQESSPYTFGPFSAALKESFPDEVEEATILRDVEENIFYKDDVRLLERLIYADEHIFSTLGIDILAGKPEDLVAPDVLFVSRRLAEIIAGSNDVSSVIGKTLNEGRSTPKIIRGVFENIPENTDVTFDVVSPMAELWARRRAGWGFDISYLSIIRFKDEAAMKRVEARLPEMVKKYMPDYVEEKNNLWSVSFRPLLNFHFEESSNAKTMLVVMSVLAIAILLIAAFNYVLISISSLARRAKSVGVHKCSGATDGNIFRMFLQETALVVLVSVVLVALLMFTFRDFVEAVTGFQLNSLFTWQTLWAPAVVVFLVFLVAGVIPAFLFASVPVSQVFRRYTERKAFWKRLLLFIQFIGVTFVLGFLVIVLFQYQTIVNKDLGYKPDRVVLCYLRMGDKQDSGKAFFKNMPMVEDCAEASQYICYGYSGDTYDVGESRKVDARIEWISVDFIPMIGIQMLKGRNLRTTNEVLVNEEFIRRTRWTDDPIGKQISYGNERFTVVGVMKNFSISNPYVSQQPVLYMKNERSVLYYLRLKEPFSENLAKLNKQMAEMFPKQDAVFESLQKEIDIQYVDVRRFRDAVVLATISIFLITFLGMLGYINDEVSRRSKEIAIRKVNGAEASEILKMLSAEIMWTALPAVIIGALAALVIGNKWLEQFGDPVHPGILIFAGIAVFVLIVIVLTVVIRTWKVSNEDPVKNIKSE